MAGRCCFFLPLFCLYRIADGQDFTDKLIHIHRICQEFRRIVFLISVILMKGDIVDILVGMTKDLVLPFAEGGNIVSRASANDKLDIGVGPFHKLCCLGGNTTVFLGRLMTHLPSAVHLVTEAPGLYLKGLIEAVYPSHIGIDRISVGVAVFY